MKVNIKLVVAAQAVVIVILAAFVVNDYIQKAKIENSQNNGLISPRVYVGLLEPKSFMIVNFAPLKENLRNYIEVNNLNVSVYVENLRNGAFMGINEKTGFFPTSLNKLPVAILVMKKIEEGELAFDTMLEIRDIDRTDSWGSLYKTEEKQLSVRRLLEYLLRDSDNTALRVLVRQLSIEDLQLIFDYYGIDIRLDYAKNDLMSPKSMSNLFSSVYFSTVLEPESSNYLLSLLESSSFDIKGVANLPDKVKVAQKFGVNYHEKNEYLHDCGILYVEESRVFYCIMTKDLEYKKALEVIGFIVYDIYSYVRETKAKLEKYT